MGHRRGSGCITIWQRALATRRYNHPAASFQIREHYMLTTDLEDTNEGTHTPRRRIRLVIGITPGGTLAQQSQGPRPIFVGNPLGLPVEPARISR
jgi:hypothetical protein